MEILLPKTIDKISESYTLTTWSLSEFAKFKIHHPTLKKKNGFVPPINEGLTIDNYLAFGRFDKEW